MNKKGQTLQGLYLATLTIVIVGILIGIGIYVLDQTSEAISTSPLSATNETITGFTVAGDAVSKAGDCGAHAFVLTNIINTTSGTTIESTNYTFSTAGYLKAVGASNPFLNHNVNVSYTYTGANAGSEASTGACGAMETTSSGVGTFADWIAVIVIVLAAAIVLGIVISSFGRGRGV